MQKALMAAGFAVFVATPALADPGCLELSQIWSWKALDNKTLIVEDNFHQKFKMALMGYCPDLTFKERVGFKVVGGAGLDCLSKGDEVISHQHEMGSFHCPIVNIVPYTPAMEKADKDAAVAKAGQQQGNNP